MIEIYWAWVGGPLARTLGPWVDSVAFPISEFLLLMALGLVGLRLLGMLPFWGWSVPWIWWFGPFLLVTMAFSQGVTPVDWVPTVFREAPHLRAGTVMVGEDFDPWKEKVQDRVLAFPDSIYENADPSPNLKEVHRAVTRVLEGLSYPPGREVTRVKDMVGLTRLMGLAYGGPAYHDVVTGEVVMASEDDLPRTKVYRWLTVVHEIAHAQGFTREIDAEVLTWMILKEMESPFANLCADLQALSKGRWAWEGPPAYQREREEVVLARKNLDQPVVNWLKTFWKKVGLQNDAVKYGGVLDERPSPDHPFFGVVMKWDRFSPKPEEKPSVSHSPGAEAPSRLPDL